MTTTEHTPTTTQSYLSASTSGSSSEARGPTSC